MNDHIDDDSFDDMSRHMSDGTTHDTPDDGDHAAYADLPVIDVPGDAHEIYRIALADFRLRRGHMLPPCVAAIIESAFVLVDPFGWSNIFEDNDASTAYDEPAGRLWLRLTAMLLMAASGGEGPEEIDLDEIGDEDDVASPTFPVIPHSVLHRLVLDELTRAVTHRPEGCGTDTEFRDIIDREFGEDTAGIGPCHHVPDAADTIARMIRLRLVNSSLFA